MNLPFAFFRLMDIPEDDEDASDEFFGSFWRIAQNAFGDAICLDERADGVVVMLDKEWGYYAQQFVNSSIGHFLLCLEAWRAMEADTGDDVDTIIETFERAVERIDPAALTEGASVRLFGCDRRRRRLVTSYAVTQLLGCRLRGYSVTHHQCHE
ncbi:MAG: SUKH-4 family immunity protein [Ignavibacteria bacterium]|nr:SUKH-4 family immunity protein [Ignavibacteria bacterium]